MINGGKKLNKLSAKLKIIMICVVGIILIALVIAITAWKISESKQKNKPSWKIKSDLQQIPDKIGTTMLSNGYYIVRNDKYIFYISTGKDNNNTLCRVKSDGTDDRSFKIKASTLLGVEDDWLYYLNPYSYVFKIKLDGTGDQCISNRSVDTPKIDFAYLKKGWIYFYSIGSDKMYKMKTDGSQQEELNTGGFYMIYQPVGDWIYCHSISNKNLYKMHLDGTELTQLTTFPKGGEGIYNIQVVDDTIYYLREAYQNNTNSWLLYKMRNDGTNNTLIYDKNMRYFTIQDKFIYFLCGESIYKMNLDGTNIKKLYDYTYGTIIVSGKWIYATSITSKDYQIFRLKTDGSSKVPEAVN